MKLSVEEVPYLWLNDLMSNVNLPSVNDGIICFPQDHYYGTFPCESHRDEFAAVTIQLMMTNQAMYIAMNVLIFPSWLRRLPFEYFVLWAAHGLSGCKLG